jgi:hypothetical protein
LDDTPEYVKAIWGDTMESWKGDGRPEIKKTVVSRGRTDYECDGRKFILYNGTDFYFVDQEEGEGVLQQLVFNPDRETPEDVIRDYL